jgi:hypothetical protein
MDSWDARNIKTVYVNYIRVCFNILVYKFPGDGGRPPKQVGRNKLYVVYIARVYFGFIYMKFSLITQNEKS